MSDSIEGLFFRVELVVSCSIEIELRQENPEKRSKNKDEDRIQIDIGFNVYEAKKERVLRLIETISQEVGTKSHQIHQEKDDRDGVDDDHKNK